MITSRRLPSRPILVALVVAPLALIGILTFAVLLPTLKDPESNVYASSIGYPALKRLLGQPIKVQAIAVEVKTLGESVAAPGESVALQEVSLRPLVTGMVEQIYVVEGQIVNRGQPLLRIQKAPFEDSVNRARNELATAELTLQSLPKIQQENLTGLQQNVTAAKAQLAIAQQDFSGSNKVSQERFVELEANVENAKAKLEIAKSKLDRMSSLKDSGALAQNQLYDVQETYLTRQNELISARQQLALAQSGRDSQLEGYVQETKQLYITRQNELFSAQQQLNLAKNSKNQELISARLAVKNSQIALNQALRALNNTTLYANTDGLISRVNLHAGEVAAPQTTAISLNQDIVFKTYIDQARLNKVKIGDKATVRLVAYPGRSFVGEVTRLNPTVETEATKSGKVGVDQQYTYSAWIAVNDLQMPPGLQGYAQFGQTTQSLVIQENAVTHLSGGEGLVMVAEADKPKIKQVKLGRLLDNQREILSGLKAGEQVVVSARAIKPSDRIQVEISQAR